MTHQAQAYKGGYQDTSGLVRKRPRALFVRFLRLFGLYAASLALLPLLLALPFWIAPSASSFLPFFLAVSVTYGLAVADLWFLVYLVMVGEPCLCRRCVRRFLRRLWRLGEQDVRM